MNTRGVSCMGLRFNAGLGRGEKEGGRGGGGGIQRLKVHICAENLYQ